MSSHSAAAQGEQACGPVWSHDPLCGDFDGNDHSQSGPDYCSVHMRIFSAA